MALDPRKLQKKLEKKRAKEKKRALVERVNNDPLARFERAATAPVLHCSVSSSIHTQGMGVVLFSRVLPSGGVAFANFLIDMYCLGVKDVMFGVTKRPDYDWRIHAKITSNNELENVTPKYARKLVEGAVSYAWGLGLAPHADYEKACRIFGDVDPGACGDRIDYGKNGKPFYIAGPHDSQAKQEQILAILQSRLGSDGYHFVIPMGAGKIPMLAEDREVLDSIAYEE